jgi:hypothetical protein
MVVHYAQTYMHAMVLHRCAQKVEASETKVNSRVSAGTSQYKVVWVLRGKGLQCLSYAKGQGPQCYCILLFVSCLRVVS